MNQLYGASCPPQGLDPADYEALLNQSTLFLLLFPFPPSLILPDWIRSGTYLYQPRREGDCCPQFQIRLPVHEFQPTKGQRKALRQIKKHVILGEGLEFLEEYDAKEVEEQEKPHPEKKVERDEAAEHRVVEALRPAVAQFLVEISATHEQKESILSSVRLLPFSSPHLPTRFKFATFPRPPLHPSLLLSPSASPPFSPPTTNQRSPSSPPLSPSAFSLTSKQTKVEFSSSSLASPLQTSSSPPPTRAIS